MNNNQKEVILNRGASARSFGRLGSMINAGVVTLALVAVMSIVPANVVQAAPGNQNNAGTGQLQLEDGKAFPVSAFSWKVTADTSWTRGGGASVGKPNPDAIRFIKEIDSNTSSLLKHVTQGRAYASAKFTATSGTGKSTTTLVYELTDLFVTGLSQNGADGSLNEEVTFVFKTVKWKITDANGEETIGTWDIPAGTSN